MRQVRHTSAEGRIAELMRRVDRLEKQAGNPTFICWTRRSADGDATQTFTSSSGAFVRFDHFNTNRPDIFAFGPPGAAANQVRITASGVYLFRGLIIWPFDSTPYYHYCNVVVNLNSFVTGDDYQNFGSSHDLTNQASPEAYGAGLTSWTEARFDENWAVLDMPDTSNPQPTVHMIGYQTSGGSITVSTKRLLVGVRLSGALDFDDDPT